jgi:hypothetical protein
MKKFTLFAALLLAVAFALATPNRAALVDCDRVVVTGDDITEQAENVPPANHWVLFKRNAGDGQTRVGPATPPEGVGSYELTTPGSTDKAYLFNYDHVGTKLSDINRIGYSTYRSAGSAQQVTALNVEIDYNGPDVTGGYAVLVFEPVYNTTQGPVVSGTWQTWDAYAGGNARWWSSKPINGLCAFSCYASWDYIVANNPDAVIVGGFGLNQGSGNPGLTTSVDNLALGYGTGADAACFTYDFEPYRVAESKDDCKDGGFQKVKTKDGAGFKNQGQCVSYVSAGK